MFVQFISIYVSIDPQSKMDCVTNCGSPKSLILTIIIVFNFMSVLLSSNETHNFACPFFLYKFKTVCKKKLRHSRGCCCALFSFLCIPSALYAFLYM